MENKPHGTGHFMLERITSLALVPLTVWFMINLAGHLVAADQTTVAAWFAQPLPAILTVIFLAIMFIHSRLGVQVIVEDYVHHRGKNKALLLLNTAAHLILGVASIAAVAHLYFGAAHGG